jgi:hypothetical protein
MVLEVMGGAQPSCMVRQEWFTRVHHRLLSDVHILDAASPVTTGVESGILVIVNLTPMAQLCVGHLRD